MKNRSEYYIGIMSGTSMDGADAVLIQMQGAQWQAACAHAFLPYTDDLKQRLLDLQNVGQNELHRSQMLAQELADLYAQVVQNLLQQANVQAASVRAIGCHGQTIRHAPECGYSIQLVNLARLAERTGIFTIGDFRSRDLAAGGQGAPLVPAFHHALFAAPNETCYSTLVALPTLACCRPMTRRLVLIQAQAICCWTHGHGQTGRKPMTKMANAPRKAKFCPIYCNGCALTPILPSPIPNPQGANCFRSRGCNRIYRAMKSRTMYCERWCNLARKPLPMRLNKQPAPCVMFTFAAAALPIPR